MLILPFISTCITYFIYLIIGSFGVIVVCLFSTLIYKQITDNDNTTFTKKSKSESEKRGGTLERSESKLKSQTEGYDNCVSSNCVRCKGRNKILNRARNLCLGHMNRTGKKTVLNLEGDEEVLQQLQQQILQKVATKNNLQNPDIFYLPSLRAKPLWHTSECFPIDYDKNILTEDTFKAILDEFNTAKTLLFNKGSQHWKVNVTPTGQWSIFHLVDQGTLTHNAKLCPRTIEFLSSLPNNMNNTVFGNAAFSIVSPQTVISPHFGSTNIRLRCHIGLDTPEQSFLTVGAEKTSWKTKNCLIFDDSFVHSVTNSATRERAVLLFDVWHPDISFRKKLLLEDIFSSVNLKDLDEKGFTV